MSMLMGEMFGVSMFMLNEPWMLILGLIFMAIQGVAYGVTLASISMRTSIPHSFLDILNFAVMGLLVVPLEGLPEALRLFIVFIPYVAPMQLMKRGISSSFMMRPELIVSCITITSVMILISIWQTKKTERWIRRHGVKGVGFM
ncbi:MAG: hypothetical protein DRM97_05180 [Thermoprotei archaeon]|nr:MAG: hypothetical protein DRM97_05180 [Thermoprotei archaeon]